jgi:hypothetical protein
MKCCLTLLAILVGGYEKAVSQLTSKNVQSLFCCGIRHFGL